MSINGVILAGGPLTKSTKDAIDAAGAKTPSQWRRYIAYSTYVHIGGSLAWRANNPGNLRDAPTKIGSVHGQVGHFAAFADIDQGRAAQKDLYVNKYGSVTVKEAIERLTPRIENDTEKYLNDLKKAGVDLERDVKSQIGILMQAVQANEGLIKGIRVERTK